jgi:hypothetical protein
MRGRLADHKAEKSSLQGKHVTNGRVAKLADAQRSERCGRKDLEGSNPSSSTNKMKKRPALIASFSLLTLPIIFFGLTVVILLGSSFYLLSHSETAQLLKEKIEKPVYTIFNSQPPVLGTSDAQILGADGKAAIIQQYLALHRSPLASYAQKIVDEAEKYGLDWRLTTAICMQESNCGKSIPANSYNAWGWAIHSTYTKHFENWEKAIETVTNGLKTDYIDRGLVTPEQIMTRYCPLSIAKGGSWARAVEYFMQELENF